jgi:hypothetical protein
LRRWSGPTVEARIPDFRGTPRPVGRGGEPLAPPDPARRARRHCLKPPAPTADPEFRRWIAGFRQRALSRGISGDTFDRAFSGVQLQERVVERDRNQAEFSRTLWDYLDSAVSDTRIRTDVPRLAEHRDTLERIERQIPRRGRSGGRCLGPRKRLWRPARVDRHHLGHGDAGL